MKNEIIRLTSSVTCIIIFFQPPEMEADKLLGLIKKKEFHLIVKQ